MPAVRRALVDALVSGTDDEALCAAYALGPLVPSDGLAADLAHATDQTHDAMGIVEGDPHTIRAAWMRVMLERFSAVASHGALNRWIDRFEPSPHPVFAFSSAAMAILEPPLLAMLASDDAATQALAATVVHRLHLSSEGIATALARVPAEVLPPRATRTTMIQIASPSMTFAIPLLVALARGADESDARDAIESMRQRAGGTRWPYLNTSPEEARALKSALADIASASSADGVSRAARFAAARGLGALADPDTTAILQNALAALAHAPATEREAAVTALAIGAAADPTRLRALLPFIAHTDAVLARVALQALRRSSPLLPAPLRAALREQLLVAARHVDPGVRALALRHLATEASIDAMLAVDLAPLEDLAHPMLRDANPAVAAAARELLLLHR
jgi:hypothetical protein